MLSAARTTKLVSAGQAKAVLASAGREFSWTLRTVLQEVNRWRRLALAIPDPVIRADALDAIDGKRSNIDGAALFTILPLLRMWPLLRLLITYEIMGDFLDCLSERGAPAGLANGRQLHRAFAEALQPDEPISDYYLFHPWRDDGGYLRLLVELCRAVCCLLPSYVAVGPTLLKAAERVQVQALNHELDPDIRSNGLQLWVNEEFGKWLGLVWYELTGSASAWISIYALLALAAEPHRRAPEADRTYAAYFWVCLAATVLDSYVDEREDVDKGDHSYFRYYLTEKEGIKRAGEIVARAAREATGLRNGDRHMVIVSSMVALYMSKNNVLGGQAEAVRRELLYAGGPLTVLLGPVLRVWRAVYSVRSC